MQHRFWTKHAVTFSALAALSVLEKELDRPSVTRTATFLASCLAPLFASYSVEAAWFSPDAVSVPLSTETVAPHHYIRLLHFLTRRSPHLEQSPQRQQAILSLPSKANSVHLSSSNISVKQHCSSPLSVCAMCVCVCVCVCVCARARARIGFIDLCLIIKSYWCIVTIVLVKSDACIVLIRFHQLHCASLCS